MKKIRKNNVKTGVYKRKQGKKRQNNRSDVQK